VNRKAFTPMKSKLVLTFSLLILIFSCNTISRHNIEKKQRKLQGVTDFLVLKDKHFGNTFYISRNPITNREYITYLCWLNDVYINYPEVFLRAIPYISAINSGGIVDSNVDPAESFTALFIEGNEINHNYNFNPVFIYYPVIGLTWNQAMNFCNWMTDRYNEMMLINRKELMNDFYQKDQNNFNTEAYLSGMYEGATDSLVYDAKTRQERRSQWSDHLFSPAFRLPSATELGSALPFINKDFTSYNPDPFLKSWIDYYTDIKLDTLIIRLDRNWIKETKIASVKSAELPFSPTGLHEYTMDQDLTIKLPDVLDIYKELGQDVIDKGTGNELPQTEKDNLGHMNFIIIGEDKSSDPVCVRRVNYDREVHAEDFTIFRFAINAVK
jgi:hypothetical protein